MFGKATRRWVLSYNRHVFADHEGITMTRFDMPEISGDTKLTALQRLAYLLSNVTRNLTFSRVLTASAFRPTAAAIDSSLSSPGRALTDLFITHELPNLLSGRGSEPIDILELGCGSGSLCTRLAALGLRGRYTGVDIDDRFNRTSVEGFTKTFIQTSAHNIDAGTYDLIISVSALEHLRNDRLLMEMMRSRVKHGGIEVHIVPCGTALAAYLWHGYRQYSLARIEHVFGTCDVTVIRLGGLCSLLVHILFVTVPEIFLRLPVRKRLSGAYLAARRLAFTSDQAVPFLGLMFVVVRRNLE